MEISNGSIAEKILYSSIKKAYYRWRYRKNSETATVDRITAGSGQKEEQSRNMK